MLQLAELPDPRAAAGEVRVRLRWSGVNPSDVKSRAGLRSSAMPFPRVVPHSDGMGVIDAVGDGVSPTQIGQRVWLWNAAWGRAFGTAAECITLPERQAVALPAAVSALLHCLQPGVFQAASAHWPCFRAGSSAAS